ncbi:MAG: HPr family phosphocarrier protein [Thermodesulfobacteriota bacterium]
MDSVRKTFTIVNTLGLHARAAAGFVKLTNQFSSNVKIIKSGYEVDGKSILGILSLAAARGTEIDIEVSGSDAENAAELISEFVESGFGEGAHGK